MAPSHKFTVVHCKEWISGRKELWMEDNLKEDEERMRRGWERMRNRRMRMRREEERRGEERSKGEGEE